MRKTLALLMAPVLTAGLLAGCGSNGQEPAKSAAGTKGNDASAAKVELTWWVIQDEDAYGTFYDNMIDKFQKQNPSVKIKREIIPSDKINEKLSIAANTGQLPDLQQGSIFWPLSYAYKDLMVPLDDIIDKADFDDAILKSVSVNNKIYIYPNNTTAIGLIVNKDLFKAKGALDLLPKNMESWTMDQFLKAAKAVTDPAKGTYGYAMYAADTGGDQGHHAMLWGYGAKSFSDDNKKAILNSPEGIEGLKFYVNLVDEKVVPPGAAGLKATEVINNMFPQGKIGMTMGNIGHIGAFEKSFKDGTNKPFELDMVPYPTKDGKGTNSVLFGYGTWVWKSKDPAHVEWAKKFTQFINSKENMAELAKIPSVVPTRKSLASNYKEDSFQGKTIKLFKSTGNVGVSVPGYAETRAAFYPELQAALTKAKTPEQALNDWVKKANDIIDRSSK
ncbi:sugar ABC transporter substrate-binding protein [Paenibacillus filicis]|uniref:Sugar ABC transporter substrate-binding protein n=1 Tax=Paenibacillus gyeongsangnamensis TaxID=3388067 RepID=A0ABT4Q8X8_9BACL|nr:sugar ABC transporter substrate-binding protein [Paenibacillus filicis]MCZ8513246.1 sugar ABC transporter substrate-binding protein [Paenibacillus filicis]